MSKVTSKYQVTMPKKIADRYAIRPGDEIDWVAAGDVIRVIPPGRRGVAIDRESQLRLFDQATERLRQRPATQQQVETLDRGWSREDLYGRGRSH
jgi:AbrB family looped-hinge helix DNA binding protein